MEQKKFKIKEWRKPPRIRKIPRCCHKFMILRTEEEPGDYPWLIWRCQRCGIEDKTDEWFGDGCSDECVNCGEFGYPSSKWIDKESHLCPECYRRTRSRKH